MMDSARMLAANRGMREPASPLHSARDRAHGSRPPTAASLAISIVMVAGSAGAAHAMRGFTPAGSIALVFLVAVLLSALSFGFWTGIAAAGLAFVAYNFFFVEPVMTLRVSSPDDFIALAVFVLVAGLTGSLAGRLREQATAAQERARLLEHLSELSMTLAESRSEHEARGATVVALHRLTGGKTILVDTTLEADPPLEPEDAQSAERALRTGMAEKVAASGWSDGRYSFYPVVAGENAPLVAGIAASPPLPDRDRAVRSALEQAGAAIRRLRLAHEAEEARRQAERESIRSAILSSLSHDLKTPLATILGAVTTLHQFADTLPDAARRDLLRAIEEDARRLNVYVGNLLHMTRLQAGLDARLEWVDPKDILNGAVGRLRRDHPAREVSLQFDGELPLLRTDAVLLEQALFNCLDNAALIAPSDTRIAASLRLSPEGLRFEVEDEGPGVPEDEQVRIFEPFQRGAAAAASGTGLGLAIAKGIVQALGGVIAVASPLTERGGARFSLSFPRVDSDKP